MSCKTCQSIRQFFRNGVQKLAPFTEYDDNNGNTFVVATKAGRVVGDNGCGFTGAIIDASPSYAVLHFNDGQSMGFPLKATRKVFSNQFA